MRVQRFDIGGLEKPVRLPNGWLRVDAYLTRTGVFTYLTQDGKTRREYRPPDEVFKADSLATFALVPFTNDHPPEPLDATNTKKYQVGSVEKPRQDGDKMRASILCTDADTIAEMERGKLEISNGYLVTLDETPGTTPEGERYDAVQRDIIGNHVALVERGRAGSAVRARMDALGAAMVVFEAGPIERQSETQPEGKTMKLKIDGIEVEIADAAAQLVEKQAAALNAKADTFKADAEKAQKTASEAQAKADALAKELAETKAALAAAPEKVRAEVTARTALEASVRKVCGAETKVDGVDDKGLRKLIAATVAPSDVKLDEKDDSYLACLVDIALKRADEKAEVAAVFGRTAPIDNPTDPSKAKSFEEVAAEKFKSAK